jgi:DNA-binding MltR family transcriptional regulator
MTWTLRDANRERKIVDKINEADDRSAAILAEALLEDRLTKAILARLREDKVVVGEMFKGYGPLASFKAKIDLAFLMGLIEPPFHSYLHIIREIRNRFAHHLEAYDFDVPMIKDRCSRLIYPETIQRFLAYYKTKVAKDAQDLKVLIIWLEPMGSLPATPRNAYMTTTKLILFMLEAQTHFALMESGKEGIVLTLDATNR